MELPLLKEIGLKDHHPPFLQASFDLRNEAPVEKVEICYEIVLFFLNLILIEVGEKGVDPDSYFFGQSSGFSQTHF